MELDKTFLLAVLYGILTYIGHEALHNHFGSAEILTVSVSLAVLALITMYVGKSLVYGSEDLDIQLILIGAISLGLVHQITHGQFLNLENTSLLLALYSFVGAYVDKIAYLQNN